MLLVIAIFYVLLKERRDPAETLAWILVIPVIPVGGIVAYMLFGRSWRKSRQFRYDDDTVSRRLKSICSEQLKEICKPAYSELVHRNFVTLLLNNGDAALTLGNRLRILNNGCECFPMMFGDLKNAGKFIVLKMIRLYQLAISPYKGGKYCSFIPTCSQYAIEAIEMYGVFLGGWLALKRILRCNPFNKNAYGFDPVPVGRYGKRKKQ